MNYLIKVLFLIVCILNITLLWSQDHGHSHQQNEIGLSGGVTYAPDHKSWGSGVHLHYFRMLGLHSKWALGGGIEQVWAEGNHFSIGAGVKYQVIERLSIGLIPGITFFKHDHDDGEGHDHDSGYNARFSGHVEIVYDLFHWEKFHLGPTVDYSWAKNDSHFMAGVHAAYCF